MDQSTANLVSKTSIGIVPTGPRIIVRQFSADEQTAGGIIIPDVGQERPNTGVVVGIGDGKLLESRGEYKPCPFVIGDKVMFGKYAGAKFTLKTFAPDPNVSQPERQKETDTEYLMMHEDDVLGIDLRDLLVGSEQIHKLEN